MASMTIRNLSEDIKRRLRIQAAEHGHSMEEEAREILRIALTVNRPPVKLAQSIRARFEPLGGVELEVPPRKPMRDPPKLG
ncbi:MAG: plasmid stabilization protein [Gemmatimonadetes bacterium]|nr:plasmid stabilization protein [Gemmatimonadota bacterium]MYA78153.1 plasmid stabilization protein [Gemmatimonadota bacterium]MYG17601.1 plasmid stabilization protein [Gemmatimonadota bacterium]MYH18262.1 plasmid stabilization protein [Gemmatimonadota bacterium]